LKEKLLRQEKFERKWVLRVGYLNEMIAVLSDPRYGSNLQQVWASVKKHEAISADILGRQERYWREQEIKDREKAIMERWD